MERDVGTQIFELSSVISPPTRWIGEIQAEFVSHSLEGSCSSE